MSHRITPKDYNPITGYGWKCMDCGTERWYPLRSLREHALRAHKTICPRSQHPMIARLRPA